MVQSDQHPISRPPPEVARNLLEHIEASEGLGTRCTRATLQVVHVTIAGNWWIMQMMLCEPGE